MYKIMFLILTFLFLSCDSGTGIPIQWHSNMQYDTLKFRLDSLSYWSSGSAGGNYIGFSCNNVIYSEFEVSFFGETNIDSINIIGSPLIEYRILGGDSVNCCYQIRGNSNINYYHSRDEYSYGDSVIFYVGFSNAQGDSLKYTRLYSLILNCIRWYYQ